MKKTLIFILIVGGFSLVVYITSNLPYKVMSTQKEYYEQTYKKKNEEYFEYKNFVVYVDGNREDAFDTLEEAIEFAKLKEKALIKERGKYSPVWENYPLFNVYYEEGEHKDFSTYKEAVIYASQFETTYVYYRKDKSVVWTNTTEIKKENFIKNVELIKQLPELSRGCEVTSLAMLLKEKGIEVDKLILAEEIEKEPFFKSINLHGNPNKGFVGNIYTFKENGLGVYHKPIFKLLEKYIPDSAIDITGTSFENVKYFLSKDIPVWVITNADYKLLKEDEFETWQTESGNIKITYREHSVLLTGYDENYIYFNDPLNRESKVKATDFIPAWEQMGSQAVTTTY